MDIVLHCLSECAALFGSDGNYRWSGGSQCDSRLHFELPSNHPTCLHSQHGHGKTFREPGTDCWRTVKCHLWECGRIHRKFTSPIRFCLISRHETQVSIIALKDGQIRIVQASMLGSMLSNLLLVLGCCFLAGGFGYHEQFFNSNVASTMSSLLAVASASMLLPATLYDTLPKSDSSESENVILSLSRGTALVLLALYGMYLVFELKTHPDLFDEERQQGSDDNEGEVPPTPHLWTTVLVLALSTVVIAICANYLVGSINSFVETTSISKVFVGLILIPIVGNAGEHATAIVVAWKNKMELAIAVALGSCLQIALFVTPSLVVLGWIVDRPMTLRFDILQTIAFFLSGFVVTRLIQDGKSNYLEGILCLAL